MIRKSQHGKFIHGNTFSGNPLACAVGLEVLRTLSDEGLVERVAEIGEYLRRRLRVLRKHRFVGEIRCLGLLAGVEFVRSRKSRRPFFPDWGVSDLIARNCRENGLYVYPGRGSMEDDGGDHILLAPPYIITRQEIDTLVEILDRSIGEVSDQLNLRLAELKMKPEGKVISLNLRRR